MMPLAQNLPEAPPTALRILLVLLGAALMVALLIYLGATHETL